MKWKPVKLGELAAKERNAFVDGPFGSNLKASEYQDSGVPIIRLQNIRPHLFRDKDIKFVSEEKAEELSRHDFRSGDLVIAKLGDPTGVACLIPEFLEEGRIVADVVRFRGNCERVDHSFVSRFLNSPDARAQLERGTTGTTRKRINLSKLKAVEIPLPPLAEQKRIAGILDAADALRVKRREAIAQLGTLLQATFLDLFGDPIANPKGWEIKKLGNCVPAINVGHVGPTSHGYVDRGHGVRFLRTQNVRRNHLDLDDVQYISQAFDQQLRKSRLRSGDVLISRVGANRGMASPVPADLEGANCANIVIVRASDKLLPSFLSELVNGIYGRHTLLGDSVGAAQGVINVGTLERWDVPVPAPKLQAEFEQIVSTLHRHERRYRGHLAELDTLFASLQSRAFKGEL